MNPENGATNYYYNAKNQKIAYTYDSSARVTQVQHYPVSTGAADPCQTVNFQWDSNSSRFTGFTFQNTTGRITGNLRAGGAAAVHISAAFRRSIAMTPHAK